MTCILIKKQDKSENSLEILQEQLVLLEELEDYSKPGIQDCINQYIESKEINKRKGYGQYE